MSRCGCIGTCALKPCISGCGTPWLHLSVLLCVLFDSTSLQVQVQGVTRPHAVQEEINRKKLALSTHASAVEEATRVAELARISAETKLKQASQAEQVCVSRDF